MITMTEATIVHAENIAKMLRAQETKEYKFVNENPKVSIVKTLNTSAASWVALVDGEEACMWGVKQESLMGGAHIWMVTTPLVDRYPIRFLRESKRIVKECVNEFSFLYGYVDSTFSISCRWMEWLGFELVSTVNLGSLELFRYEMRAQDGH